MGISWTQIYNSDCKTVTIHQQKRVWFLAGHFGMISSAMAPVASDGARAPYLFADTRRVHIELWIHPISWNTSVVLPWELYCCVFNLEICSIAVKFNLARHLCSWNTSVVWVHRVSLFMVNILMVGTQPVFCKIPAGLIAETPVCASYILNFVVGTLW